MAENDYLKLAEYLDQFPLGYPKTSSGVEIRILELLFTPQEAETVMLLSPLPEDTATIAARTGSDPVPLDEMLEKMADKGLVFRIRRRGKTLYRSAPFMIGLYEYSVKRIDRELAELFKQYYDEAYQTEMGLSNIPGFKVIPIQERLPDNITLLPYQKIEEGIRTARVISVADCVCRKENKLTGHDCGHPLETCLSFGAAAEFYIESGLGREVSADEAISILKKADDAGLVHAGANAKHLSNICNCCPCCCASMKGIVEKGHDKRKYMNAVFEAIIDEDLCTLCENCLDRCPVKAISIADTAIVNRDVCLGCGLCAGVCPSEAIIMQLREDREEPYEKAADLFLAILEAKKRNMAADESENPV